MIVPVQVNQTATVEHCFKNNNTRRPVTIEGRKVTWVLRHIVDCSLGRDEKWRKDCTADGAQELCLLLEATVWKYSNFTKKDLNKVFIFAFLPYCSYFCFGLRHFEDLLGGLYR